ncbi:hypothetical protein SDC9_108267 [bioreactor metagenome]|uniref:Uncharacterized protein n=1 Tax=bioreactor metagenome TaxID=1076179 RepID=A0A645B7F8_9ZZZZ
MVLQIFNAFLIAFAIGFITVPAFWLYGIYDAYTIAEKINNNEEVPKNVSVKF